MTVGATPAIAKGQEWIRKDQHVPDGTASQRLAWVRATRVPAPEKPFENATERARWGVSAALAVRVIDFDDHAVVFIPWNAAIGEWRPTEPVSVPRVTFFDTYELP